MNPILFGIFVVGGFFVSLAGLYLVFYVIGYAIQSGRINAAKASEHIKKT